jgi:phosphoketolase
VRWRSSSVNGFKIANPTVLARISRQELTKLLRGYGYDPHFVDATIQRSCINVSPVRINIDKLRPVL